MIKVKEIPKHWQIKKLGEVCDIKNGKNQKAVVNPNGKYPIYGSAGIMGHANDYLCEEGTTIVGRKGTINSPIYVKTKFWNVDTAFGFSPNLEIIDSRFLFFFCQSFNFQKLDKSTTIPSLAKTDLQKIELVVPPLLEQQGIVAKIEELISKLDNSKAQLIAAQQQLKVYRQSLLKWAFEGKLTNNNVKESELPQGWCIQKLGNFLEKIEAGKSFRCEERTPNLNEVGVLKVSAVTWQVFNEIESKTVIGLDKINTFYYVKKGNFLFSRANTLDLIGAAVIVDSIERTLMLSDKTLRFKFKSGISQRYILYFLRSRKGRREIQRLSTGNQDSMRNIGQERIKQIDFPFCPINQQQHIVDELESKLSVCDQIEATICQSLRQAETLRQSILKQAFEGKLVTMPKAIDVYKPKNEYFYQMQFLGLVVKSSNEQQIEHGEMTLAKYAYLLDKIYKIPTYYKYDRWHLGPYPPSIKRAIYNRQYFKKNGANIDIVNEKALFKSLNPYQEQIQKSVQALTNIFSKYPAKERPHKTELLATVCKVIEDIKVIAIADVRASMKKWTIDLKSSNFKTKFDKFTEKETKDCIDFIVKNGWDNALIHG